MGTLDRDLDHLVLANAGLRLEPADRDGPIGIEIFDGVRLPAVDRRGIHREMNGLGGPPGLPE